MLFEPLEHSTEVLASNHRMLRSEYAVTRTRQPYEFNFFAVPLQRNKVLFRLFDRHTLVVFSM
jgi:hypothetical protein